ncbi:MAG: spermidine/putrescine ABC transporter substrate-binding protein [Gammaproteobacteria bacterium]|nr:spermidine/putrescine ABC transporter substrate-binding protein [Gammaproteobacteria bacterium]
MSHPRERNRLQRWFASLAAAAAVFITASLVPATAELGEELVFLTWADYLDPDVVAEFEHETGIKIRFAYYESDDGRDEILTNSDGRGYDLAIVNGLMLKSYAKRNWLAPMAQHSMPNLAHLEPRWRTAFPAAERYGVPYFWGTLGIAYRQDLVPEGFNSWEDFFQPAEKLRGRIAMLKSSRDILGMALKSLGHSANTNDRNAVREAGRLLEAQRPFVRSYEYISLNEESALVTGDVWASLAYSGDALMVQEHHDEIVYVVPDEGGNLWVDYFTVLQASPRKDLAAKFIDFLNRPQIAARNAEFVYYATPNNAARELVSDDYAEDPVIHPADEVIARSEVYRELMPRTQKAINSVFAQLVN